MHSNRLYVQLAIRIRTFLPIPGSGSLYLTWYLVAETIFMISNMICYRYTHLPGRSTHLRMTVFGCANLLYNCALFIGHVSQIRVCLPWTVFCQFACRFLQLLRHGVCLVHVDAHVLSPGQEERLPSHLQYLCRKRAFWFSKIRCYALSGVP
jgi:hypothetical protein